MSTHVRSSILVIMETKLCITTDYVQDYQIGSS